TYFTILVTSWRVSKLNIIRAIRQIPEPPTTIRIYTALLLLGLVSGIAGVLLFQESFASKSAVEALVGPSLAVFGMGLVLSRFVRNRYAFTFTGLALLVQWAVPSFSWNNPIIRDYNYGPELYFAGGILMVFGGVLVVMYNTDLAIGFLRLLYRGRKTLTPIFRTALAYPENRRFRTAATVAMFALVIFTVSAIGSIAAEQNAAVDKLIKQDSGGYDIITTTVVPLSNLTAQVHNDQKLSQVNVIPFNSTILRSIHDVNDGKDYGKPPLIIGASPDSPPASNFFLTNTFNMVNMTRNYKTATDVWNDVRTNSTRVVWSFGQVNPRGPAQQSSSPQVGDILELTRFGATSPTIRVEVVGVLNGVFYEGLISRSQLLFDSFGVATGTLSFVKVGQGQDPVTVANILRRDFVRFQMSTLVIPVLLGNILQLSQSILGLFEGFLGLGLVVGIAGLGILSVRAVVERRQEIGVLRALGFKRRMVIMAFIIENSYVALLGILIGVILGVNLGYAFAVSPGSGLSFVLPWQSILGIVGLAYGLSLLTTFNSSRRAGGIPPAQALRYSE
ncbi:MAG TPA: FtsX-like permease family protein, partial [Candidatus Binatus sp.]|nr:FtsX-like permease family protein [Candidatus Binatus sp.]